MNRSPRLCAPPFSASLALLLLLIFPAAAWAAKGHSLKDTARDLVAAALGGSTLKARAMALSFEQVSGLTTKVTDRAAYDKELEEHLAALKTAGPLPELRIEEVLFLPAAPGGKRQKEVVMAVIRPIFSEASATERWEALHGPFYFIQTEVGWRLSIKK